jgi:hypothetical protein
MAAATHLSFAPARGILADMTRQLLALVAGLVLCLGLARAQSEDAKPSTPEDRAKAVQVAHALEADPLAKGAKEQRLWVLRWIIEVPDIRVPVCNLLGPVFESQDDISTAIFNQMAVSSTAFIIQNPDKAKDDAAVYTAGVEGSLRAYESILKTKPKARWSFLDDLIAKRNKGELAEFVRQTAADQCKAKGGS